MARDGIRERIYNPLSNPTLQQMYDRWANRQATKVELEREVGDEWSKGRGITRAWKERLGHDTEGVDPRDMYIRELERKLKEKK